MKVLHFENAEQINVFDERFYTKDDGKTFYPSVTQVLSVYPKGFGFDNWLKTVGMNAEMIRDQAAEAGSRVHNAIEQLLYGTEINWQEYSDNLEEWVMINKFIEFYDNHVDQVISVEQSIVCDTMRAGGTIDLVCKINGQIWLVDFKTSNALRRTHDMQQAAYVEMWNNNVDQLSKDNPELKGVRIERAGILWLKAKTRGIDKKGIKMQAAGWQIKEITDLEKCLSLFHHTRMIYDEEHPNDVPKTQIYPDKFKLKKLE